MKIWKNALFLSLILLIPMVLAVGPAAYASPTTTLAAPNVISTTSFSIDITVADVTDMWGFNFKLVYDTTVLTATGYSFYAPFTLAWPSSINDGAGYVSLARSMPMGVLTGFSTVAPAPIAKINFDIDGPGASQLVLADTAISDIYGNSLLHVAIEGSFRTEPGLPIANFYWTPETPRANPNEWVTFTSTSFDDGTIVKWSWAFGDGKTGTGETTKHKYLDAGDYLVTLTVTDNDGKTDSFTQTLTVLGRVRGVGAVLQREDAAYCTLPVVDFTAYGYQHNTLVAIVRNLNKEEATLVRVVFMVYCAEDMHNFGALEPDWQWIPPFGQAKFEADMNVFAPHWGFGWTTMPEMEYKIVTKVYYQDYEILPGQPHWTQITDSEIGPSEREFIFLAVESAPVPVLVVTQTAPYTWHIDGTGTYDPDAIWGDYISLYRISIYRRAIGGTTWSERSRLFVPVQDVDLSVWPFGINYDYRIRLFAWDMFSVYDLTDVYLYGPQT